MKIVKEEMTINYPVLLPDTLKWNSDEEEYKKRAQKVVDEKLTENLIIEDLSEIGFNSTYAITNNTSMYLSVIKDGTGSCTCESFTYQTVEIPCKHLIVLMQAIESNSIIPVTEKTKELVMYAKEQYEKTLAQNKHTAIQNVPTGSTIPAVKPDCKPIAKSVKQQARNDTDIEVAIKKGAAERLLSTKGDIYKVSGQDTPDSAMLQKFANEKGISLTILEATQTKEFTKVHVKGEYNGQTMESVVVVDMDAEQKKRVIETAAKYPHIIVEFDGLVPVLNPSEIIEKEGKHGKIERIPVWYHISHGYYEIVTFVLRTATTKAMSIVIKKLLYGEFRDKEEIDEENKERAEVEAMIEEQKRSRS